MRIMIDTNVLLSALSGSFRRESRRVHQKCRMKPSRDRLGCFLGWEALPQPGGFWDFAV